MATFVNVNRRLLESFRDEPKKLWLTVSGHEQVKVKTLKEACEPLEDIFDQKLQQYITTVIMNSTEPSNGLTPDESAAIHLYTLEWDVHENSLYMILNRTLCLPDRTKFHPWFKYLKLILTAFYKLPQSEHTLVWRGVREDLSGLFPRGKEFAWWAFSSCTTSVSVLESSNYLGKSGARTMFSIQSNSGKEIRAHSYFENEDEILLPTGIYLKVIDIVNPAEDLHIIHLREILPPHQLLVKPFDLSPLKPALTQPQPSSSESTSNKKQENYPTSGVTPKTSVQASLKNSKLPVSSTRIFISSF